MTQTQDQVRTRTFSWSDPAENAAQLGRRSGLETLRSMLAGELPAPPVTHLLGMSRMTVDEGRVTVELVPQEFHYNPLGSVHGGVISTLLDTAAGCAVHSTLPAGVGYTSLDLNVKFLRPVTVDSGTLRCEGAVLQSGRRTALAEARLLDARDRLVAHATSSCLLFPLTPTP
ncbi:PaaI family thioesterase [Micromonospora sp. NPDC049366]|uniref:PaaI family thioesterase n=1 Tax=Micromonospora sp. NPDC049366 TaxID=3364271 RepID=UPI0037B66972